MKLLLYCTKAKPYIMKYKDGKYKEIASFYNKQDLATYDLLNGKIVAECDFEVEKIMPIDISEDDYNYGLYSGKSLLKDSCLDNDDICEYLKDYDGETIFKSGYAIHIKNLHIFDKSRELDFYSSNIDYFKKVEKAPQNMMKVWEDQESPRVLISIRPEWLCKILNGEKTIEVRKKVLKEMLK